MTDPTKPAPKGRPEQASIDTAREMIDNGQTEEYAAAWLARNCPEAFKDAKAAKAAISQ